MQMSDNLVAASEGKSPRRYSRPVDLLIDFFAAWVALLGAGWALNLHLRLGLTLFDEQILCLVLGPVFVVVFLTLPAVRGSLDPPRWFDYVLGACGLAACAYLGVRYPVLSEQFFFYETESFLIGLVVVPLVLEALRRVGGLGLVCMVFIFMAYALFGDLLPGRLMGRPKAFTELIGFLTVQNIGIFGISMKIVVKVVILYILLGAVLQHARTTNWFTDLSAAVMGRTRGGSAKIAVLASSLFGSISGSAVSNVASTGAITIPMMKQAGFKPRVAAGIEAVASTGGQLMPPIMGASAFLMAEFLEMPYTSVITAALVPALLYYIAVLVQVDLEAAKTGIAALSRGQLPRLGEVLRLGWPFTLPFIILLVLLFAYDRRPEEAAAAAIVSVIVAGMVFGYRGERLTFRGIVRSVCESGVSSSHIVILAAMAGIMIGILNSTGLGFVLTFSLVSLGEASIIGLLAITAVVCVILGMGMPTVAVYILVATIAVPPLVRLGVSPLSAHFFVFYFGLMSMITPPVALAAFTAARIADTDPMSAAMTSCRLGWVAFIIPFLFVFSPTLLMQGSAMSVVLAVVTAIAGTSMISAGMIGYLLCPLDTVKRVLFVVSGFAMLLPAGLFEGAIYADIAGAVFAALLVFNEFRVQHLSRQA